MHWPRALAHVVPRNSLPWLLKQKERKYCESPTSSERFCLLWHSLLLLTLHSPQKVTVTARCQLSYGKGRPTMFMKGRKRRYWYLENSINYRLMGENTDSTSECLVHSRRQSHASSLQRFVPILWDTSSQLLFPSFRGHSHIRNCWVWGLGREGTWTVLLKQVNSY